jgi:hypothetical protein
VKSHPQQQGIPGFGIFVLAVAGADVIADALQL